MCTSVVPSVLICIFSLNHFSKQSCDEDAVTCLIEFIHGFLIDENAAFLSLILKEVVTVIDLVKLRPIVHAMSKIQ